jgi:hypothetical protein
MFAILGEAPTTGLSNTTARAIHNLTWLDRTEVVVSHTFVFATSAVGQTVYLLAAR